MDTTTFEFTVRFSGRDFKCEYWPGLYNENRVTVTTAVLPGDSFERWGEARPAKVGQPIPLDVDFDLSDWSPSEFSGPGDSPFVVREQAAPLFVKLGQFWRLRTDVSAAIVAGLLDVLRAAEAWPPRLTAALAKAREHVLGADAVRAAVGAFARAAEAAAIEEDNAAEAFAATGARVRLAERPTGVAAIPSRDDLLAARPLLATEPVKYECLECGATYDDPSKIEAGGMGCVRCN